MRGHVILAGLAAAGLIGLAGPAAPAKTGAAPIVSTRPAPCRVINAIKAIQARRKLTARLARCERHLIRCYEKLDQQRNQITFRDVLGGVGWIFGLCGLGLAVGVLWRDHQRRTRG